MRTILVVITALLLTGCGQVEKVYVAKYEMVDASMKKVGAMEMTLRLRMSASGDLTSVGTVHIAPVSEEGLTEPILRTIRNCDFFDEDNWSCKDNGTVTSMREGELSIKDGDESPILFDVGGWYIKPLNYTLQTSVGTRVVKVGNVQ